MSQNNGLILMRYGEKGKGKMTKSFLMSIFHEPFPCCCGERTRTRHHLTVQIPVVTDAEHDREAGMTAPATLMNSGDIFVRIKK